MGREHVSPNIACTAKPARELSIATGRPSFAVEGFPNAYAASKFDLQGEITDAPILDVVRKNSSERGCRLC